MIPPLFPRMAHCLGTALLVVGAAACASRPGAPPDEPPRPEAGRDRVRGHAEAAAVTSPIALYRDAGLIVSTDALPFVGLTAAFAGPTPDSTLLLVALSIANDALSFSGESESRQADYTVRTELSRGDSMVRAMLASPTVRVGSARETARAAESIVFQQILPAPPGRYTLAIAVRDAGSGRSGTYTGPVVVPRFDSSSAMGESPSGEVPGAAPRALVPVYEARPRPSPGSLPSLIPNPRATFTFGQDSLAPYYVELYGRGTAGRVVVSALGTGGALLWRDSVSLPPGPAPIRAGTVRVPVSSLGPGTFTIVAVPAEGESGARTRTEARAPLFISLGEGLGFSSFEEVTGYLRYFATPEQLRALERAAPEARARAWANFLGQTDRNPATPENEALLAYVGRIRQANAEFAGEGMAGWLTERGRVYVTLGEPDQIAEQSPFATLSPRGSVQVWSYTRYQTQLVFVDETGLGRWRLTPRSAADFATLAQRQLTK